MAWLHYISGVLCVTGRRAQVGYSSFMEASLGRIFRFLQHLKAGLIRPAALHGMSNRTCTACCNAVETARQM